MKSQRIAVVAALLVAGLSQASAQDIKMNVLTEVWYTQMLDNNIRKDSAYKSPNGAGYYEGLSSGRFGENTFTLRRSEIYLNGKISDSLAFNLMFDPNNSTSTTGNNVLHDAVITWTIAKGLTLRAGQFKMPTTYEATMVAAKDIYFFDRSQINRYFGDKRDRGVQLSYAYGDPKGLQGKVNLAISNGSTDDGSSGKTAVDANAQKDLTVRYEGAYGTDHKFGFYYREGETNVKDAGTNLVAGTTTNWGTGSNVPTAQQIKDNKDRATLNGVYYAFDTKVWHAEVECVTGLLGRRFPTIFSGTAGAVGREHLDQKFFGYALAAIYKMGNHQIAARHDILNYNYGDKWYTANNPYLPTTGANAGGNFSPLYKETTLGYNYVFNPAKYSQGKLKIDYIMRSKNFLSSSAAYGQTGAQGGNTLMATVQVGF